MRSWLSWMQVLSEISVCGKVLGKKTADFLGVYYEFQPNPVKSKQLITFISKG